MRRFDPDPRLHSLPNVYMAQTVSLRRSPSHVNGFRVVVRLAGSMECVKRATTRACRKITICFLPIPLHAGTEINLCNATQLTCIVNCHQPCCCLRTASTLPVVLQSRECTRMLDLLFGGVFGIQQGLAESPWKSCDELLRPHCNVVGCQA